MVELVRVGCVFGEGVWNVLCCGRAFECDVVVLSHVPITQLTRPVRTCNTNAASVMIAKWIVNWGGIQSLSER